MMSHMVNEYVDNCHFKSSVFLLKIRIWFRSSILLSMVIMGFVLLRIDFTVSEDPAVRLYQKNRWLLITSWFNILGLGYVPASIYCDWRELQGTNNVKHVKFLNQTMFVCFTSLLYPITAFSDVLFWKLWTKDRELVAPHTVDVLFPLSFHHCLHSVSLVLIVLDLLLVPRRRPKNIAFGASLLGVFLFIYGVVCAQSIINNEHIYPLLKIFSGYQFFVLVAFVIVEHYLYFTTMWFIIDYIWGQNTKLNLFLSPVSFPERIKKDISEAKKIN